MTITTTIISAFNQSELFLSTYTSVAIDNFEPSQPTLAAIPLNHKTLFESDGAH